MRPFLFCVGLIFADKANIGSSGVFAVANPRYQRKGRRETAFFILRWAHIRRRGEHRFEWRVRRGESTLPKRRSHQCGLFYFVLGSYSPKRRTSVRVKKFTAWDEAVSCSLGSYSQLSHRNFNQNISRCLFERITIRTSISFSVA